jgi:DNA helicase-4
LFKKKNTVAAQNVLTEVISPECKKLLVFKKQMDTLLSNDHYVARSEYSQMLIEAKATMDYFEVLKNSGMLKLFCTNNDVDVHLVESTLAAFKDFSNLMDQHNEAYIQRAMVNEKLYLDMILREVDPVIMLDDDQRRVVLTDEDYCLVIAGAGAGKTTTVAAKVKYLVEKKGVDPEQILVVSFTNKAVQELRDKLNRDLKIDCPVATFHSTGNAILRKQYPEKLNIVDSGRLYFVIQDYFRDSVLKNERLVNNLIMFFSSYFDAPYEGEDLNGFFNKMWPLF